MLQCWTDDLPDAAVVHAEGEVDLSTVDHLGAAIADAFARHGRVIVDLSRLDYLDVSGTRVLERAAVSHNGRFAVVASKPNVHRIFEVLDLADVLPVVPSVEAAQEFFRRTGR